IQSNSFRLALNLRVAAWLSHQITREVLELELEHGPLRESLYEHFKIADHIKDVMATSLTDLSVDCVSESTEMLAALINEYNGKVVAKLSETLTEVATLNEDALKSRLNDVKRIATDIASQASTIYRELAKTTADKPKFRIVLFLAESGVCLAH